MGFIGLKMSSLRLRIQDLGCRVTILDSGFRVQAYHTGKWYMVMAFISRIGDLWQYARPGRSIL